MLIKQIKWNPVDLTLLYAHILSRICCVFSTRRCIKFKFVLNSKTNSQVSLSFWLCVHLTHSLLMIYFGGGQSLRVEADTDVHVQAIRACAAHPAVTTNKQPQTQHSLVSFISLTAFHLKNKQIPKQDISNALSK